MQRHALNNGLNLFTAIGQLDFVEGLNARARKQIAAFRDIMEGLSAARKTAPLAELGQLVFERSGYLQMLREENTPEAQMREENVEQLIAFMTEFSDTREEATLEAFLEEIALMSPMDETEGNGNAITLMTLHSAKGLEYPVVFMCGMEENLFPTARSVRREPPRSTGHRGRTPPVLRRYNPGPRTAIPNLYQSALRLRKYDRLRSVTLPTGNSGRAIFCETRGRRF